MTHQRTTRRRFLRQGLAAGALITAPALLPGGALPSKRFQIAHIGVGGRGSFLLGQLLKTADVDVVAICEVDRARLEKARGRTEKKADAVVDYRSILDRKDVDAVVVAPPDHWHPLITIDACASGKDVYVEKPLGTFVAEGRAMVTAARKHGRVVQMGVHHRSARYIRDIVEIIRSGRIGRVTAVKTWMWDNLFKERTPPTTAPPQLDYDRWLGPAPKVPYHADRVHFNFRWCSDYAGGYMTDWGVHMMDVVACAMNIDHKGPVSVDARGEFYTDNLYDFPRTMEARWEFRDPDFSLTWSQPGNDGDILPGTKYGMTFYGEAGQLRTKFGGHEFWIDGKKAELPGPARSVDIPVSPGHFRNFLDSITTRERPIADVEIGHRTTSLCQLGNISLFAGRALRWDWKAEEFLDDALANGMLSRANRAPYGPHAAS